VTEAKDTARLVSSYPQEIQITGSGSNVMIKVCVHTSTEVEGTVYPLEQMTSSSHICNAGSQCCPGIYEDSTVPSSSQSVRSVIRE
jgi:hypothetical protein